MVSSASRVGWVWLEHRPRGRRTVWILRWMTREGVARSQTIGMDRIEAQAAKAAKRAELTRKASGGMTWREFVLEDLSLLDRQPKTIDSIERTYRHVDRLSPVVALADVTPVVIERFRRRRLEVDGVSPASANLDLRNLRAALWRAVDRGHLKENPFHRRGRKLFVREPEPVPVSLEAAEVAALIQAAPTPAWEAIITIAVYAGLRAGEVLALAWDDVDFRRGVIHVRNSEAHRTKSGRNRAVPMDERLRSRLWKMRARAGRGAVAVLPSTSLRASVERQVRHVSTAFAAVCRRAELVDHNGRHKYTLHDLRRTCITEWLRGGLDVANVREMAGHASMTTTLRHYAAVKAELQVAAVGRRA